MHASGEGRDRQLRRSRQALLSRVALALLLLCGARLLQAAPVCAADPRAAAAVAHLRALLAQARFITYEPTSLQVIEGRVQSADASSIRADLEVLRRRFDALITYDAIHGAEQIAPIAAALHYRALIIGVWNPLDERERSQALATAARYPRLVAGLSLGNEMIFTHRADAAALAAALKALRAQRPQLPLSISEPFHIFESAAGAALLPQLDFLLVNVHPLFQPWFASATDATAAQFVVNVADDLAQRYCGPILIKESGLPSGPPEHAGLSAARQASFYKELRARLPPTSARAFAYFSAFDAPWRTQDVTGVPGPHPEEAYWGLYDAARRPKAAVEQLAPLEQDRAGRNTN
ncbi:MAG TPA: hypothetical protein VMG33_10825 [Steroidobacteraceae bacterium]|nr:hypothetical protein [Steroidobacteraceae bacterium]